MQESNLCSQGKCAWEITVNVGGEWFTFLRLWSTANKCQGKKRKLFTTITWMKIDRKEGLCCNYPREFTSFFPLFTYCSNIYSAFTVFPPNVGNFLYIMTLFIKMAQRILFFVFDIKLFSNDEFNASQKKFKFISKTFGHFRKFSEFLRLSSEILALPG